MHEGKDDNRRSQVEINGDQYSNQMRERIIKEDEDLMGFG